MNDFSILAKALGDIVEPQIDEYMRSVVIQSDYKFSEKFERKMKRLIKRREKPYFRLICTTGRRIACTAAAIIIILSSALRVEAVREAIHDFLMYIFNGHTAVSVSGTIPDYPSAIEEIYEIADLPAGFEQIDYYFDDSSVLISYFREEKYIFFEQNVYYDFEGDYDNSHSEFEYYTDEFGQEYLIQDTGTDYCIIFNNGRYIIRIISNLNKDDVINLCKSTKIK